MAYRHKQRITGKETLPELAKKIQAMGLEIEREQEAGTTTTTLGVTSAAGGIAATSSSEPLALQHDVLIWMGW